MKRNMGNNDRAIRLVLAALFVVLYLNNIVTDIWGIVLLALAGIFTITSIVGFCPLYSLFKINTNRGK
jgi:hypothetical protein